MRIETYRRAPFVDREEEVEFFVSWFQEVPQRILWVYGPKSSGKTTVVAYVIDNYLLKNKKFWIKYFNLRETLISSYESFIDTFFVEVEKSESEAVGKVGINVFGFSGEIYQKIKKKQINLFKTFIEELERLVKKKKRCVIVIDEIQKLRDIYIKNGNGERELLKEFLNFCVSLTKERHLSHVVILTSNTIFIERIYNDARLKETSDFVKIDHLKKEQVKEWLKIEGLSKKEIDLVWEYLGGSIPRILKVLSQVKNGKNLKEFLEQEAWFAYTEIDEFLAEFKDEEVEYFKSVAEEIVEKGYYSLEGLKKDKREFLAMWAEREILFYDPLELKIFPNSKIYVKGLEIFLKKYKEV
ncbi:MAG: AAA family ATPase [Thermodesulfobacteria bacterium]|nr:AAA family ATPase [Thermodesulfobacteriota bacterium]